MTNEEAIRHIRDILAENNSIKPSMVVFELEKEALYMAIKALEQEPAEWIVDTDDSRRWDRARYYCSACNDWNTYGKSKYCPNCGRRMQSEEH